MRVVIKATALGKDGIGYYTQTLLDGLGAAEAESQPAGLEFVALTDSKELVDVAREWPHFETVFVENASTWWEHIRLPVLLAENSIDLYHSPAFSLPSVKACLYVPTVHNCIPTLFPGQVGENFSHYFREWAPRWFRAADHLLCNSQHTAHDLSHLYGVSPDDISVVHHTGNPDMIRVTDDGAAERALARLGINRPFILMVGRVELRKNISGMLQAFGLLTRQTTEPLLLVLAGPRDPRAFDPDGIIPPLGCHGDVLVTGHVTEEELAALYSSAAVFCFPTFYEGFGRPLLEAMQCGTPVVTTRVSSLREVGGDACLYVSPYDPQELAQALYRVLTDATLRAEMIAKGKARAAEFTVERMARETLAVYERVASAGVGRSSRARRRLVRNEAIA